MSQRCASSRVSASVIGQVSAEPGLRCLTPEGELLDLTQTGYRHFDAPGVH